MTLGPAKGNAASQRPHQQGQASGMKAGHPITARVEWMFDTGAEIGVLRKDTAGQFDLAVIAGTASPTTGGSNMLIKNGLTVAFSVECKHGHFHRLIDTQPIGVKPNNSGSNIIGMNQLAAHQVTLSWDPNSQSGSLRI